MTSKQMWGNLEQKFSDAEAKEGREGMECADHIMGKRQGLKNGSIQSELSLPPLRKTRQTRNTQVQGGQVKFNYRCDRETLLYFLYLRSHHIPPSVDDRGRPSPVVLYPYPWHRRPRLALALPHCCLVRRWPVPHLRPHRHPAQLVLPHALGELGEVQRAALDQPGQAPLLLGLGRRGAYDQGYLVHLLLRRGRRRRRGGYDGHPCVWRPIPAAHVRPRLSHGGRQDGLHLVATGADAELHTCSRCGCRVDRPGADGGGGRGVAARMEEGVQHFMVLSLRSVGKKV